MTRPLRIILFTLLCQGFACVSGGVLLARIALHVPRKVVTPDDRERVLGLVRAQKFSFYNESLQTGDGITLRAWEIRPRTTNGNVVIVLHGAGDNRTSMLGYAQLLLDHGYSVLLPDSRAHGESGGDLSTYGLLERNDIRQWFDRLRNREHFPCIYGLGESMGAAQLLQSLQVEPGFCAVVAESPFSNFHEIAYDRVGQFFHVDSWLGRTVLRPMVISAFVYARWKYGLNLSEVAPETAVASTSVPVLLIHGEEDRNIPIRHSLRIQSKNSGVKLWKVHNAGHCGAIGANPEEFNRMVMGWFSQHAQY